MKTLYCLFLFFLFSILLTFPVILKIDYAVAGDGGDSLMFMWNFWHFKKSLLEGKNIKNIFYTSYQFYPLGTNLYFHTLTLFNTFLAFILQFFTPNLILIYNILFFLNFWLAGVGMFYLIKYLTKNEKVAFIAGIAFAFCPYHMSHAFGHLNLMTTGFIPLFFLFFLKNLREKSIWNPILSAVFLLLIGLSEWQYLGFTCLFMLIYLLLDLVLLRNVKVKLNQFLIFSLFAFVLIFPFFYPLVKEYQTKDYMKSELNVPFSFLRIEHYFLPSSLHPLYGKYFKKFHVSEVESNVSIGYTILLFAIYYLIKNWKKAIIWLFPAFIFFLLSLPPKFQIFGKEFVSPIFYLFHQYLPFFNVVGNLSRFALFVNFPLIVLFSLGLNLFFKTSKKLFLVLIFLVFEFLALPFPTCSLKFSKKFYEIMEEIKIQNVTVLNLPPLYQSPTLYLQTLHEKPIFGGYVSRTDPNSLKFLRMIEFYYKRKDFEMIKLSFTQHNLKYIIVFKDRSFTNNIAIEGIENIFEKEKLLEERNVIIYRIQHL